MPDPPLSRDKLRESGLDEVVGRRAVRIAIVWSLVCLIAFVSSALRRAGTLSPPVDDAYIYLQYAKRLATGHGFEYSDGNGPSTGATSYLYTFLLTPGYWLGLRGRWYLLWSLALGAACFATSLVCVVALLKRIIHSREIPVASVGASFVALNGFVLWGVFSGMEIALHMACMLGALALVAARGAAPSVAWIACAALAWVRPEGAFLGGMAIVFLILAWIRSGERLALQRRALLIALASFLLLIGPTILNVAITGSLETDTYTAKAVFAVPHSLGKWSLIAQIPEFWADAAVDVATDHFRHNWTLAGGAWQLWRGEPWMLGALTAVGAASGAIQAFRGRFGPAGVLLTCWFIADWMLIGVCRLPYMRYYCAGTALWWVLVSLGWGSIAAALSSRWRRAAFVCVAAALAVHTIPHAALAWNHFGWNCENTEHQQTAAGQWLRDNTAPGTRVVLNDAGAIAYWSERPTLDVIGLTSHGWAQRFLHRPAALYEALDALPEAERPKFIAIFPELLPELVHTSFLGPEVARFALEHNTINAADVKSIYKPEWRKNINRREPQIAGFAEGRLGSVVDSINIGDLSSEQAHAYEIIGFDVPTLRELGGCREGSGKFIEGARMILGSERFNVRVKPGRPLHVVVRAHVRHAYRLAARIGGTALEPVHVEAAPEKWQETVLDIPIACFPTGEFTAQFEALDLSGDQLHEPAYYWFLQE